MATKAISGAVVAVCVVVGVVGLARGGTIALAYTSGDPPDGNGYYSTFTDPVLNNLGQLAFRARLQGTSNGTLDDTAIIRAETLGATVVCHENWPAGGFNGVHRSLYLPAINNSGQVLFRTDATGTLIGAFDAVGIYCGTGGVLPTEIVRGNDFSPDGNGVFLIMSDEPLLNDTGKAAFWSSFTGTAGGLTDDTGVVGWTSSGPSVLLREGLPVLSGDGQFAGFNGVALNQDGKVCSHASLRNTSGGDSNDTGLFQAVVEWVREGDAPPDGNGEYSSFGHSFTLDATDSGRPAFHAWLRNTIGGTDDDSGIFRHTTKVTGVTRIAREAQSPPDGNGQYHNFGSDVAQNDEWVAFRAWLRNTAGGADDDEAIYRGDGTSTTKIVRGGDPAPGGNGVFQSAFDLVMNAPGHVAFQAQLAATAGGSGDNRGLFLGDGVEVVEVARKGDPLLGGTIAELHLATGPDCRNGLNDLAQVAYRAVLADGREVLAFYTPLVQWKGGINGDWDGGANWTLGIRPSLFYHVAIAPSGSADVAGSPREAIVKSLTVGSTGGGTAALNLTYGGGLTALEDVTIGADGLILVGAGRTLAAARLLNEGTLAFEAGRGDVLGDVTNSPGGQLLIPPGADVWLHDLLENEGVVDVGPGGVVNLAELTGNGCTGAGTTRLEGHVRPGLGIGQMAFEGDVILGPGSAMHIELGGLAAGLEHDQVLVGGDLVLDGRLTVTLVRPFALELGQYFEIMDVGAAAAGQFSGLGEGDLVGNYGGLDLFVTYAAGDGNDVAVFTIPEPASALLLALGFLALRRRLGA